MKIITVNDMHCEKCVERISKVMSEEGFDFVVNLEEKTVSVGGDEEKVKAALELLDDIGFTAEM